MPINLIVKDNFFEKAYDRLGNEFKVVLKISDEDVKKKMNKALGREDKPLEN